MTAWDQDRVVVFARLTGAYWLEREGGECAGHGKRARQGVTVM